MKPRLSASASDVPWIGRGMPLCLCLFIAACASAPESATQAVADLVSGAANSRKAAAVRAGRLRSVDVRIEGAKDLNAGADGNGLATVIRLYKLRDHMGFLALPDSAFGGMQDDKEAIGGDLIEARELTLAPGQRLDLSEKLSGDAAYIGIVALFHSPAPQRWRFAFPAAEAERSGIAVGIHTCAMSATKAPPVGMSTTEAALLSAVRCGRSAPTNHTKGNNESFSQDPLGRRPVPAPAALSAPGPLS